jgi:hypothetical protein
MCTQRTNNRQLAMLLCVCKPEYPPTYQRNPPSLPLPPVWATAAPHTQSIPQVATAPVLVLVGAMMMGESTHIDWSTMMTAVPAFLTIVIQPFTFSIANGIYAGIVMTVLLYFLTGTFLEHLGCGGGSADGAQGVAKDEGAIATDYEAAYAPLLGDGGEEHGAHGSGAPPVHGHAAASGSSSAAFIPIGRGDSAVSSTRTAIARSLRGLTTAGGSGTPYERGSFSMYINTFGSHTASPRGLLGSGAPPSEEPEH